MGHERGPGEARCTKNATRIRVTVVSPFLLQLPSDAFAADPSSPTHIYIVIVNGPRRSWAVHYGLALPYEKSSAETTPLERAEGAQFGGEIL